MYIYPPERPRELCRRVRTEIAFLEAWVLKAEEDMIRQEGMSF
jgi:hypothetical protein